MGMRVVVLQMGLYRCTQVSVREIFQDWDTLVNVNIMKHKVGKSIKEYPDACAEQVTVGFHHPEINQENTGDGKNNGKYIVPLDFSPIAHMVIFMQDPEEAVHNVFVGKPRHEFHKKEGADNNYDIQKKLHWKTINLLNRLV